MNPERLALIAAYIAIVAALFFLVGISRFAIRDQDLGPLRWCLPAFALAAATFMIALSWHLWLIAQR